MSDIKRKILSFINYRNGFFCVVFVVSLATSGCSLGSSGGAGGVIRSVNEGQDFAYVNNAESLDSNGDKVSSVLSSLNVTKMSYSVDGDKILMGSYNQGLFYTFKNEIVWKNILSELSVYDFVQDKTDPKILFAVGNSNSKGRVLRSLDFGSSWLEVFVDPGLNDNIRSIAQDPNNLDNIVIGTQQGNIYVSLNKGDSWTLAKNLNSRVRSIKYERGAWYILTDNALYQSSDLISYTNSVVGLENSPELISYVRYESLASNYMYLLTTNGLYRQINNGSYEKMNIPVNDNEYVPRALAISVKGPSVLYLSTGANFYVSYDGGLSWRVKVLRIKGYINTFLLDANRENYILAGIYSGWIPLSTGIKLQF